jgi:hypothetical protein
MTCRKWQYLLATAEACELADNVALQEHLATCRECAQFASDMRTLARATRSLPRLSPSPDFGAKVRRRLDDPVEAVAIAAPRARLTDLWTYLGLSAQPQVAVVTLLALLALLMAYCQLAL